MTQKIQVQYEKKMFRPLTPVRGLREHDTAWMILCAPRKTNALRALAGTLSSADARAMQAVIATEFGKVEGEW